MPLLEIGMLTAALVEIVVDAGWDRARKHEAVQRVLRKLGRDFDPASQDFSDVYNYTLVAFGMGKPPVIVEVFYQPPVRDLCRRAFDTGDTKLAEGEIRELIDWPALEKILVLDVSPERLLREFLESFQDAVSRSRTVVQISQDRKLSQIIEGQEQISQRQSEQFAQFMAVLSQRLPPEDPGTERVENERIYDSRLDQARQLIEEDKADAALVLLEQLEGELRDRDISQTLRFRLLTNLGACFLPLGQDARAVPYFEQALKHAPSNPKALSNAGLAALIQNEPERALMLAEQALKIEANHPPALAVWVQAMARTGRLDQIDEERQALVEREPESRRALAVALTEAQSFELAEALLRRSVDSSERAIQDLALLAQAILGSVQRNLREKRPLPWATPAAEASRLQEAEGLLDQVVDAWSLIANRRRFQTGLGLRMQARAWQGKLGLAEQDCQRILLESPRDYLALYYSGLIARRTQDFGAAIRFFERCLEEPQIRAEARVLSIEAYLQSGHPQQALDVLAQSEDEAREEGLSVQFDRLSLAAKAASNVGDNARIAAVMERLQSFPQDDPEVLEVVANVDVLRGDMLSATDHLLQAIERADGSIRDRLVLHLASLYYYQNELEKAIPLYETVVPVDRDTPPTREYLVCLLNSGRWDQAYRIAGGIRNGGAAIPVVSEVEARIAEYIGDLDSALHLYQALCQLEPDNSEHFLRIASILIRQGKDSEAAASLGGVLRQFWDDPKMLIGAARVYAVAARPANEVISLAYRARQLGQTPGIHLAYVGLFMKVENDPSLELGPTQVVVGSSVQLTAGAKSSWYTVLEEEPARRQNLEFLASDSVAKALLGLKVGDKVRLGEAGHGQQEYLITEIQSKYVRALQETMLSYGTWFPDHAGLQRVDIVDGDFSPVFLMTGAAVKWQAKIHELYTSRQVSLEGFSQIIGRGLAAVWGGSIVGDNRVIACLGNPEEQVADQKAVASCTSVTADLLALFTLSHLQRLPLLPSRFEKVYITQGSIDVLLEEIQELRQFDRDHGWIGLEGDRFVARTVPKQATEHSIRFLEEILTFAREHCVTVPIGRALELGQGKLERLEHYIGRSSITSMLAAKETQSLLYSDDLVVRNIAKGEYSVVGAWTQPVLVNAKERGLLSATQYYDSVAALVLANYHYVALNSLILMHVLERNQWTVTPEVAKVFDPLAGTETQWQGAIGILSELVGAIWHKPIFLFSKQQIVDLCLRTLAANRGGCEVLEVHRRVLRKRFPPAEVDRWFAVHRLLAG